MNLATLKAALAWLDALGVTDDRYTVAVTHTDGVYTLTATLRSKKSTPLFYHGKMISAACMVRVEA
jgi:hypothetical protein